MNGLLAPPPIKSPFDDLATKGPSLPWVKWFQSLATYLNSANTYTPVVAAGSGTFTSVNATGRYRQIGKLIFFQIVVAIVTNGTAAGGVFVTLPFTSVNLAVNYVCAGRAVNVSGKMLQGRVEQNSNLLKIVTYDNLYPGADGEALDMSGFYEIG